MKKSILLVMALTLTVVLIWQNTPDKRQQGIRTPDEPIQHPLLQPAALTVDSYQITFLANIEMNATVLSRKNYYLGSESDLSPTDLVLGWGRMSDPSVLQSIDIKQRNRWYYWRTENFPIPRREIEISSANMHFIPADKGVKAQLKTVRQGDIVSIRGKLVEVLGQDGWQWRSSLTRRDTGGGSCELIWLESIFVVAD